MIPAKEIPIDWVKEYLYYRDGKLFWKKKPSAKVYVGDEAGRANGPYIRTWIKGRPFLVHRVIYAMHYGDTTLAVDHINGNKQDNRIENLRALSSADNLRNRGRVVGVTKSGNKWMVCRQLESKGKTVYMGTFETREEAEDFSLLQNETYFPGIYTQRG